LVAEEAIVEGNIVLGVGLTDMDDWEIRICLPILESRDEGVALELLVDPGGDYQLAELLHRGIRTHALGIQAGTSDYEDFVDGLIQREFLQTLLQI
jgi:hypothetical protein